ncbi:TKL protein kinase [Phytophthora megakarya]|uniref:TKL protein kinase n=1 Tax=Phytophthora megakarya TaxID=4795 RepID=A0A225W497_9STRA|nr:TKL protein kinase [Phytophthora megakarya]
MLIDFGLSFLESGSCYVKNLKDSLGVMAWRAPEFGHMTILTPTRKSDVYSFGMCIIEAVTFKNPWIGYSNEEIRHFLRKGEVKVNRSDEMTDPQWDLVTRMIAVSPNDRPDVSDVTHELKQFAEEEEMDEIGL